MRSIVSKAPPASRLEVEQNTAIPPPRGGAVPRWRPPRRAGPHARRCRGRTFALAASPPTYAPASRRTTSGAEISARGAARSTSVREAPADTKQRRTAKKRRSMFTPYAFRSGIGSSSLLANARCRRRRRAARLWSTARSTPTTLCRCAAGARARCLFRPVSTCTLADAFPICRQRWWRRTRRNCSHRCQRPLHTHDRPQQGEYGPRVVATRTSYFKTARQEIRFTPREHSALAAEHLGARWYITQAVAYLTRPNEALQLVTVHLAKTLSLDATSRYVSVHIRRGDKGSEAALHPTEAYADVIRNISKERHIDRVLLASDDKNVYDELPALLPDVRVDYCRMPRGRCRPARRRPPPRSSWRTSTSPAAATRTPTSRRSATTRRPLTGAAARAGSTLAAGSVVVATLTSALSSCTTSLRSGSRPRGRTSSTSTATSRTRATPEKTPFGPQ